MKSWFHRFVSGRGMRGFHKADLAEVTQEFPNPARGWYQIHGFSLEQAPDLEEQRWCLDPRDTLVLVLLDIGGFKKQPLDGPALDRILGFFAERGYDCIVRATYDREGKAPEREPFFFSQVLAHMGQIAEVVGPFSPFIFQGMLVGNWGEMHTSRFLSGERLAQLAGVLRDHKSGGTYLAVRRPSQWRMLHGEQAGGALDCTDNMGLFDDGMFGSESHLGTFGTQSRRHVPWDSPWCREDELEFENRLSRLAPHGGEAVYGGAYVYGLSPGEVLADLRRMGVTYLNRAYDPKLLDIWKEWKYPGRGAWAGKSVLDYVGAHLGYRFLIRDVRVARRQNGPYRVEVEVQNTGFAPFYQEAWMGLEYTDDTGQGQRVMLDDRVQGWGSGEVRRLVCEARLGAGELFLAARRTRDGACIRFANPSDGEGKVLLGRLYGE